MKHQSKVKIGILGAGAMGTALAKIINGKDKSIDIWCYEQEVAQEINTSHTNNRYLKGIKLPETINATCDLEKAARDKDFLLLVVPSPFVVDTVKRILHLENIREGVSLLGILTKGFVTTNRGTKLIVESLENYLPGSYKGNLVYISGPSHAEEVATDRITGLISASPNPRNTIQFKRLLSGSNILTFSSLDIIGVQVCGALKNVIAIGFGIIDALKEQSSVFGDNTESLLLAAGLNEIQRLGMAMGSTHPETFTSIAGVGDLDVTCRSAYGRNRRFGREIIFQNILSHFADIDDLITNIDRIGYFPEGVFAARRAFELAKEFKLKLPISTGVYKILNKEVSPSKQIEQMLKNFSIPESYSA